MAQALVTFNQGNAFIIEGVQDPQGEVGSFDTWSMISTSSYFDTYSGKTGSTLFVKKRVDGKYNLLLLWAGPTKQVTRSATGPQWGMLGDYQGENFGTWFNSWSQNQEAGSGSGATTTESVTNAEEKAKSILPWVVGGGLGIVALVLIARAVKK